MAQEDVSLAEQNPITSGRGQSQPFACGSIGMSLQMDSCRLGLFTRLLLLEPITSKDAASSDTVAAGIALQICAGLCISDSLANFHAASSLTQTGTLRMPHMHAREFLGNRVHT